MSSKVMTRVNNYLSSKLDQLEGLDLTAHTLANITRSYYDHQIKGMEKIPSNKAAILVYYHGVIPVDYPDWRKRNGFAQLALLTGGLVVSQTD